MLKKIILFFLGLLLTFSVVYCQQKIFNKSLSSLPQHEFIQVYFNHNLTTKSYQEPYRKITREGDNLEQVYLEGINSAQTSIDLAVQEFRLPNLAKALVKQAQKGVKVRVIIENIYNKTGEDKAKLDPEQLSERDKSSYEDYIAFVDQNGDKNLSPEELNERDALIILRNGNIPLIDDTEDRTKGTGLMHHKFMIIDNKRVITGSANLTLSDTYGDFSKSETRGNANNILSLKSEALAQIFTQEFNTMWGDGPGGNSDSQFGSHKSEGTAKTVMIDQIPIKVKFSPDSNATAWENTSNGLINQYLKNAKESVDLALFVFSEQQLVNTLQEISQKNVKIRGLIDPEFAFRYYSEGLDMLGVALSDKCRYEVNNKPWQIPIKTIGIPNLPKGDKFHHKFAIIDQKIVITGSHNWSNAANYTNDETLLIIEDPLIAKHYLREFENVYKTATLGISDSLKQKIEKQSKKCDHISSPTTVESGKIININTASLEELISLPSIGEKTAQKIIIERQKQPFTSLEDLTRVSGMGEKKIKKLQGKVTF